MGLDNPLHIILLLLIVALLFGAKRLPELGRSLGEGMRGFKESLTGHSPEQHNQLNAQAPEPPQPAAAAPPQPAAAAPAQPAQPASTGHPAEQAFGDKG